MSREVHQLLNISNRYGEVNARHSISDFTVDSKIFSRVSSRNNLYSPSDVSLTSGTFNQTSLNKEGETSPLIKKVGEATSEVGQKKDSMSSQGSSDTSSGELRDVHVDVQTDNGKDVLDEASSKTSDDETETLYAVDVQTDNGKDVLDEASSKTSTYVFDRASIFNYVKNIFNTVSSYLISETNREVNYSAYQQLMNRQQRVNLSIDSPQVDIFNVASLTMENAPRKRGNISAMERSNRWPSRWPKKFRKRDPKILPTIEEGEE